MTESDAPTRDDVETGQLMQLARRALEPLARMLVGRLPYDTLAELLREALIRAARDRLRAQDPAKRITKSALALMIGIDNRALEASSEASEPRSVRDLLNPYSLVLEVWAQHPDWQDPETGQPMELPTYGAGNSFQTLVTRTVGRNISYSEIMETLLKARNIERRGNRRLILKDRLFKPPSDVDIKAMQFSANIAYCLGLNIHQKVNSSGEHAPNASLTTSQEIPEEALPALREAMSELLLAHAREIGATLEKQETSGAGGPQRSAGVGWFYFEEPPGE